MRLVGLIGGTGWISTADYYRYINEEANRRRGDLHFAEFMIYSVDFGRVVALKKSGRQAEVLHVLLDAGRKLKQAGAEALAICANTMHMFAEKIEAELSLPIIHGVEATGREVQRLEMKTVGLLGTKPTMEEDFYKGKLRSMGIETLVPEPEDRDFTERAIFEELLKGIFDRKTKDGLLLIIDDLREKGAEGIILGCTEIPLIIKEKDTDVPLLDTTRIHAKAIVDFALGAE
jgi:aspartate racemase